MGEPAQAGTRLAIDRQKLSEWGQTLFKGTAYLTLILLDVLVIDTILNHFDTIVPAGWFAIFWLAWANVLMFPKIGRSIFSAIGAVLVVGLLLGALVLFYVAVYWWWSPTLGLIIAGAAFVGILFAKLDAINANLTRANELKQRELNHFD